MGSLIIAMITTFYSFNKGYNMMNNQTKYRKAKTLIPGGTHLLGKRPEMYAP